MIIYKQWKKTLAYGDVRLFCEGWFLLGFIPIYVKYYNYDLPRPRSDDVS